VSNAEKPAKAQNSVDTPHLPPESVAWLIVSAVGWMLLSIFTAFVAELALLGVANGVPQWKPWIDADAAIMGIALLLVASVIEGQNVGNGNLQAGLGNYSIAGRQLIIVLGIAEVAIAVVANEAQYVSRSDLFSQNPLPDLASPGSSALLVIHYVLLGPLAEELFFRGWLWTGLRKRSSPLATATITSVLWIGMHLLPVHFGLITNAVVFSYARHVGNSVRASLALHAIYNGSFMISTWLVAHQVL
jgi:membrane protease YdiL (CAAX protease family)